MGYTCLTSSATTCCLPHWLQRPRASTLAARAAALAPRRRLSAPESRSHLRQPRLMHGRACVTHAGPSSHRHPPAHPFDSFLLQHALRRRPRAAGLSPAAPAVPPPPLRRRGRGAARWQSSLAQLAPCGLEVRRATRTPLVAGGAHAALPAPACGGWPVHPFRAFAGLRVALQLSAAYLGCVHAAACVIYHTYAHADVPAIPPRPRLSARSHRPAATACLHHNSLLPVGRGAHSTVRAAPPRGIRLACVPHCVRGAPTPEPTRRGCRALTILRRGYSAGGAHAGAPRARPRGRSPPARALTVRGSCRAQQAPIHDWLRQPPWPAPMRPAARRAARTRRHPPQTPVTGAAPRRLPPAWPSLARALLGAAQLFGSHAGVVTPREPCCPRQA
jgi:hypothetical protein